MLLQENMGLEKKLEILGDAAKYDVACTSSGVDRQSGGSGMGNSIKGGICHSFSADGRCISLLKILMTNECIFNCRYCVNRAGNDVVRTSFTPEEIATLTMEFYRRNYIEGLFLSSGVMRSPDYTVERMFESIRLLRVVYGFGGYIHVKTIPGADPYLTEQMGWLADRMSVNLELPTNDGLRSLAPNKTRKNILTPMRQIQLGIKENRYALRGNPQGEKAAAVRGTYLGLGAAEKLKSPPDLPGMEAAGGTVRQGAVPEAVQEDNSILREDSGAMTYGRSLGRPNLPTSGFVPAGQSTQMIIGATPETDYQIMSVAENLYKKFDLKRVFYSAFVNVNQDSTLPGYHPALGEAGMRGVFLPGASGDELLPGITKPPLDREHRLYQADFLLRFYGFHVSELLSEEKPNFNMLLDPKCDYALRHLELFPVEVNKADYFTLLRVPGIGVKSAKRIIAARKTAVLDYPDLKKIGVVLKRAIYFITCRGKMMYPVAIREDAIVSYLVDEEKQKILKGEALNYKQLSLFDLPPAQTGLQGAGGL